MFSRAWAEVVTISKSAIKLNVAPELQEVRVLPLRSLTFWTFAILASLAVQFSFCLFTKLYSFCKQVCPNAGTAITAITSSTATNGIFLQQLVRQLIIFPPQKLGKNCAWNGIHISVETSSLASHVADVFMVHESQTEIASRQRNLFVQLSAPRRYLLRETK